MKKNTLLLLLLITTLLSGQHKFDADGSIKHFYAGTRISFITTETDILQHYQPDKIERNCLIGL